MIKNWDELATTTITGLPIYTVLKQSVPNPPYALPRLAAAFIL